MKENNGFYIIKGGTGEVFKNGDPNALPTTDIPESWKGDLEAAQNADDMESEIATVHAADMFRELKKLDES
jgi:hypothetical protein